MELTLVFRDWLRKQFLRVFFGPAASKAAVGSNDRAARADLWAARRAASAGLLFRAEQHEFEGVGNKNRFQEWSGMAMQIFNGQISAGTVSYGALQLAKLRLSSLPASLQVHGTLDLRQCQRLRRIGDGLSVDGNLLIGGRCEEKLWWEQYLYDGMTVDSAPVSFRELSRSAECPLVALPEHLSVGDSLVLRRCRAIERFPNSFRLGGGLTVQSCDSLSALPDPLRINGDLTLVGCRSLATLPEKLEVTGSLRLCGLSIDRLPNCLKVGKSISIEGCPRLSQLPDLHVAGNLSLRQLPIEKLPAGLRVDATLVVDRCSAIMELPASIAVGRDIIVNRCRGLASVADGLRVRRTLKLTHCPALTRLPDGLHVNRVLDLTGAGSLQQLPRRLRVDHTEAGHRAALILTDCSSLSSLPTCLDVRGPIDVGGSGLTGLPDCLAHRTRILWRGFVVSADMVFHPERLTAERILHEPNAEVRRLTLERVGIDAVLNKAGAKVIDADTDAGGPRRLIEIGALRPERYLDCRCPSTGRQYLMRVDPGATNCHAAAAWLAGFTNPDEYRPLQET